MEIEKAAPGHGVGAMGMSWGLTGLRRRRGPRRRCGRSRGSWWRRAAGTMARGGGDRGGLEWIVDSWWARGLGCFFSVSLSFSAGDVLHPL
jgi:hypothetical protein